MENIRNKIIDEFRKLDVFRYTTADSKDFDREYCEHSVVEALEYHCNEHTYSTVLKKQLLELYGNGFVTICGFKNPYERKNILWRIEDVYKDKSINHKPFSRKNSLLFNKNIFHVHHSQSFYSMANCIRYFKSKFPRDEDVLNNLKALQVEYPDYDNIMPIFANGVLLESLNWHKKTGEWLVYKKVGNKYKFLCLYLHDSEDTNDENLFSLIKDEI